MSNPKSLGKPSQPPERSRKSIMARTVEKARSAETGRFIPMKEAEKHPRTTVVEKVKVGPTKRRK
jgi:hypothetical protein